jgi:hypothetical protein
MCARVFVQLCCQTAVPMLNTTREVLLAQVKAGLVPVVGKARNDQSPALRIVSDFAYQCGAQRGDLSFKMWYLDDDLVAALSCIAGLPQAQRTACESYANSYGTPWVLCLATLEPPQIGALLERCTFASVKTALTKKCPVGKVQAGAVWQAMGLLADPAVDWQIACGKVNAMNHTQIALPGGVTAFGWIGVGAAWLPRAFGVGAVTTDMACLKHVAQELGASPSVAKAQAYFADLVAACAEAAKAWSANGRPASVQCPGIDINGVLWNIHVRSRFGKAEVFHVDSGYGKSPWVKK